MKIAIAAAVLVVIMATVVSAGAPAPSIVYEVCTDLFECHPGSCKSVTVPSDECLVENNHSGFSFAYFCNSQLRVCGQVEIHEHKTRHAHTHTQNRLTTSASLTRNASGR